MKRYKHLPDCDMMEAASFGAMGNSCTCGATEPDASGWRTIESCPDKESVLFFCGEFMQVGRMEHDAQRTDGSKRNLFWGWFGADENPPAYWMPLPKPPAGI